MPMTVAQTLIIILSVAAGTIITKFTPFLLFPEGTQPPRIIVYLGGVLPAAMMGLLVIYCLRGVSLATAPHGAPELISIAAIVLLHSWKSNVLLSIGGSTVLYMFLLQTVF